MSAASERDAVTLDKIGAFLELDFRRLSVWLRAGLRLACLLAVIGAIAAGAYALMAERRYTVTTDILINPANLQVVPNDLYPSANQPDGQVLSTRSKQRILTSGSVLSRVVQALNLAEDPEFVDPGRSGSAESDPKLTALKSLARRVDAEADEKSFVTTLSVSATSVDKALLLSQAIVKAFQEELAETEASGAGRAAAALDKRLDQLRKDVQKAEQKVEAYRRDNDLAASNGQLVSSQKLTPLNNQIMEAQSRVIAAQANLDALVASGAGGTYVSPDVSGALIALRERANSLKQQLDSQAITFGARHPSLLSLKAAYETTNAQLKAEFARLVASARLELDKAKASLNSLNAQMLDLKGSVFSDNDSEVALRELQRDAAAKTAVYENFLARARQITEREQIDTTNVQVISAAVPPLKRAWPPSAVILIGLGAIAGFGLGLFLAIVRGIAGDMRLPPGRP
ncbi:GumC family protein [Bosea sp. (in: a-proteobacteria)]|uniref:GumC family protein n=1 Tax=Bosea sp. (in: a-proteobacteria) TaxID=1871050 RepID=UPI00263739D5|nr:GumC family protein [Bosea sp. (in: a-proteobacteria)]MCO5090843.1 GumC family protein [Bosea sp. (in: a-proteobacteria)]